MQINEHGAGDPQELRNQDQQIVAVVHQWITAFNAHDVAAIVALYAEDAELFDAGMKRRRLGRAEITNWFTTRFRTIPTIAYTPATYLFGVEQAVVTWTARGNAPHVRALPWLTRPFEVDGISYFTFRNGVIQRQRGYYDHFSVLEQIIPPLKWVLPFRL